MSPEDLEEPSTTRRNFIRATVAAAVGTSAAQASTMTAGGGDEEKEETSRARAEPAGTGQGYDADAVQRELEEYVDDTSRERLWEAFGYEPGFDTVETRQATGAVQLVTYDADGSGKVSHVIGEITGYDADEQSYIGSKAEEIAELYKDRPNLYASTTDDVGPTEVERVSPRHEPDLDEERAEEIDQKTREKLDDESRRNLWQYFGSHPGAEEVSVQELDDDTGYQLTIEDEKGDRTPVTVYGMGEATGFSDGEQEYVKNNLDELHALYRQDPSLYLDDADA